MVKICLVCNNVYGPGTHKPNQFAKKRFCSRQCAGAFARADIERVLRKVTITSDTGCHEWTGHLTNNGYGRCGFNGKRYVVHRLMWERVNGPVPDGLQLDHLCANKRCCNPDHLRAVTAKENTLAETCNNMAARHYRRTVCPKCGGEYSMFSNGVRYCKPCRSETMAIAQRRRRAAAKLLSK